MWGPGVGTGEQSGGEGEEQAGKSEGKPVMFGSGVKSPGRRKVLGISWPGVGLSAQNFIHVASCQPHLFPAGVPLGGHSQLCHSLAWWEIQAARALGAARGRPTSLCTRPLCLGVVCSADLPWTSRGPMSGIFAMYTRQKLQEFQSRNNSASYVWKFLRA